MAFCCCKSSKKSSKQVTLNEVKDVKTALLNEAEENDHVTPAGKKPEPIAAIQVTGKVDISGKHVTGVAKLSGSIYILCKNPSSIIIHQDQLPFERTGEVSLDDLEVPWDLASSTQSSCLYLTDSGSNRVYKVSSPSHQITRWLEDVGYPHTLTVTDPDDQVLIVKYGSPSVLEIYGPDAEKIRDIQLPVDIEYPKHAVRSSAGNYAVSGKVKGSENWGVFEVSVDGEVLRRLTQFGEHLTESYHLAVDSADRLIVADCWNHRVLVLDKELSHSQELMTRGGNGLKWPWRLHYVASDNQLLVLQHDGNVSRGKEGGEKDAAEEQTTNGAADATGEEEKTKKDVEIESAEGKKTEKEDEEEEATVNGIKIEKPEEDDKKEEEEEEEKTEGDREKAEKTSGKGLAVLYVCSYL